MSLSSSPLVTVSLIGQAVLRTMACGILQCSVFSCSSGDVYATVTPLTPAERCSAQTSSLPVKPPPSHQQGTRDMHCLDQLLVQITTLSSPRSLHKHVQLLWWIGPAVSWAQRFRCTSSQLYSVWVADEGSSSPPDQFLWHAPQRTSTLCMPSSNQLSTLH